MRKLISIVSPCYNEETNIEICHNTVKEIMDRDLPDFDYEHIFADNASSDRSVEILRQICQTDSRIKVIVNARNYGPFRSTFNALKAARGDAVLVMLPVDLQDPPELIPVFVRHWQEGAKIVYGQRMQRQEGLIMRSVRRAYYRAVSQLADVDIPVDTAEFQLIDRVVMDALLQWDDYYPYIRGMLANCGFVYDRKVVPYTWKERRRGLSKNRLFNLIDQGFNGLISFSALPLRMATLIGFCISVLSIIYAFIQLALNILPFGFSSEAGIPTIIVSIFFFSGVQLFFIGILGEYIGAIHAQLRRGAIVIERERINLPPPRIGGNSAKGAARGPDNTHHPS
jgi:polyisoprenyl-phosphate glycosyltransferase